MNDLKSYDNQLFFKQTQPIIKPAGRDREREREGGKNQPPEVSIFLHFSHLIVKTKK